MIGIASLRRRSPDSDGPAGHSSIMRLYLSPHGPVSMVPSLAALQDEALTRRRSHVVGVR